MKRSDSIDQLAAALALAQGVIKNPERNKHVSVQTRSGGDYSFEYATLDAIMDAIRQPLSQNGLSYTQTTEQDENGKFRLETTLLHSSGQYISSITPIIVEDGGNQKFGSALTFMRRYALQTIVGVAADTDDDANIADGNTAKLQERKPRKPAQNVIEMPLTEPVTNTIPIQLLRTGNWVEWGRLFLDHVKTAPDRITLEKWEEVNKTMLGSMQEEMPKAYERLQNALSFILLKMEKRDG